VKSDSGWPSNAQLTCGRVIHERMRSMRNPPIGRQVQRTLARSARDEASPSQGTMETAARSLLTASARPHTCATCCDARGNDARVGGDGKRHHRRLRSAAPRGVSHSRGARPPRGWRNEPVDGWLRVYTATPFPRPQTQRARTEADPTGTPRDRRGSSTSPQSRSRSGTCRWLLVDGGYR